MQRKGAPTNLLIISNYNEAVFLAQKSVTFDFTQKFTKVRIWIEQFCLAQLERFVIWKSLLIKPIEKFQRLWPLLGKESIFIWSLLDYRSSLLLTLLILNPFLILLMHFEHINCESKHSPNVDYWFDFDLSSKTLTYLFANAESEALALQIGVFALEVGLKDELQFRLLNTESSVLHWHL